MYLKFGVGALTSIGFQTQTARPPLLGLLYLDISCMNLEDTVGTLYEVLNLRKENRKFSDLRLYLWASLPANYRAIIDITTEWLRIRIGILETLRFVEYIRIG